VVGPHNPALRKICQQVSVPFRSVRFRGVVLCTNALLRFKRALTALGSVSFVLVVAVRLSLAKELVCCEGFATLPFPGNVSDYNLRGLLTTLYRPTSTT